MSKENFPPIRLEEAKTLTKNWRTYYADLLRAYKNRNQKETIVIEVTPDDQDIFRGFTIPLKDLKNIIKTAKKYNKHNKEQKIDAVRAYLAMGEPGGDDNSGPVHVLLLPVAGNKDEPHAFSSLKQHDKDEDGSIASESSIYDFTTPCPDMCDLKSPLYK